MPVRPRFTNNSRCDNIGTNTGGVLRGAPVTAEAPTLHEQLVAALPNYRLWLHHEAWRMVLAGNTAKHFLDDLVQEGYIAMWRSVATYDPDKGSLPAYLTTRARFRMMELRNTERWTRMVDASQQREQTEGFTQPRGDLTRQRIQAVIDEHVKQFRTKPTGLHIATTLGMSQAAVSYQLKKMGTVAASRAVDVGTAGAHTTSLDALTDAVGFDVEAVEASDSFEAVDLAYHDGEVAAALDRLTPAQRRYVSMRFWEQATPTELREAFGYDPKGLWPAAKARLEDDLGHLRALVAA